MSRISVLARGVLAAAFVAFAASFANAQTYKQIVPGGDTVNGDIASSADVDRFPYRLVEGTKLSFTVKAGKGSLLKPSVTILGLDREPDAAANAVLVTNTKGTQVALKKHLITQTGLYYIEIRGAAATTGTWILTGKVALPKGFTGIGASAGGNAISTIEFTSPGNATASIAVASAKGSLAVPVFESLKDPKGGNVNVDYEVPTKKGFGIKGIPLPEPGKHVLKVKAAVAGGFTVKVKWKVIKPVKKIITENQVITDPIPTAIDPEAGDISETLAVTLECDFAVPGAKVVFRKGATTITIPATQVTVGAETASFNLALALFQKGTYDVEIENPDTGKGTLPAAFAVVLSPAEITSVSPAYGFANQTNAILTVNGKFMNTGATFVLNQGFDEIVGANVSGVATALQATFDLTGHAWGFYDVTVTNPGVVPTTLAGAFEIRNPLPIVAAISPEHNRDDLVVEAYITGAEFDDAPTIVLRKSGEFDIPGADVVFGSDTELTCTFDTTGAAPGSWDVVVTNPDLGEGSLEAAFNISGPVGSPSQITSASYDFDGPPSVVYNSTRDEFVVAYIDENSSTFDVYIEKLDAQGGYTGERALVSQNGSNVAKKDAVVAWDNENNQYCVVWSEKSLNASLQTKSSIFAQRVSAVDLSLLSATNIKVGNNVTAGGYYMDAYEAYKPDVCWDATTNVWNMIWMCEYNTTDDLDMHQRTMTATDSLNAPTGPGVSGAHEAEPTIVYDPSSGSVYTAHRYRSGSTAAINIRLGTTTVSVDSAHQKDPDLVVDDDTGQLILTWTQGAAGGSMVIKGGAFSGTSVVGSLVTIASGGGDHFMVRKAYNSLSKETLLSWTRKDASNYLTVLTRRATTGTSGLTLIGVDHEPSLGATDEATPFVGANSFTGQNIAFWLKTMTFAGINQYGNSATGGGAVFNGQYRGKQIWRQRYQ